MNQYPAYELFEELGRGAHTVVYRSYDLALGREVAIKELDETARRDPRHRERFLREAQFLAQFEHDNVLRVYSVDTERGWIIMELMKGTLASVIAAGPSSPDLVRSVLKQTLEALAFLHDKNKVHGTVRPTNLLINEVGRVKLSEFEQTDAGGELRAPRGSKKYLAPELIRSEFGEFGPPLDLYCLGFTALELLKGPQFDGLFPGTGQGAIDADLAWLRWHSSPDELPPARKLVRGIPDDLAHVLDQMLKKRAGDRPQSAQAVLKELADRPLLAVPLAGMTDEESTPASEPPPLAPAVVRRLAEQQTVTPYGAVVGERPQPEFVVPALAGPDRLQAELRTAPRTSTKKGWAANKTSAATSKPAPPRFSKDWFNQQLGRPWVLYPLCALILAGALWLTIRINSAKNPPATDSRVAVQFDVSPDPTGLKVDESGQLLTKSDDGTYRLEPGSHSLTFRKEGFQPFTQKIEVSAENKTFSVQLEPTIKFHDVLVSVTPPDAQLRIGGTSQTLSSGRLTHKLEEGQPLKVEARRDGYVPVSRVFTTEELNKLNNRVALELDRERPKLSPALVAKPGAPIDAETELPTRVLAAKFTTVEPLELALVKPGTYSFGAPNEERRDREIPKRAVQIERPFYIAIHETTNAQYQRFFEAEGPAKAGDRWQRAAGKWAGPLNLDPLRSSLPVTNVSPQQAQTFCAWIGGRLPTEIEWESAVRGPQDRGYPYPWGSDEPNRERCRIFYGDDLGVGLGGPVPVDELLLGASPLGLMHAIGNAAEWCQNSEQRRDYILRGCSIGTANIHDIRVTWRATGNMSGEEDTGFRVLVPAIENDENESIERRPAVSEAHRDTGPKTTSRTSPYWLFDFVPWDNLGRSVRLAP
jgi:serine/threonine protein kinase/formylglycine-generating enzyme required for sulfatase activity